MKKERIRKKTGFARLMELAGKKKGKLTAACLLAVLSSAARMVPFFTIYGVISILIRVRFDLAAISQGPIGMLAGVNFAAALVYGVCAYISSALAHTAA